MTSARPPKLQLPLFVICSERFIEDGNLIAFLDDQQLLGVGRAIDLISSDLTPSDAFLEKIRDARTVIVFAQDELELKNYWPALLPKIFSGQPADRTVLLIHWEKLPRIEEVNWPDLNQEGA